MTRTRQEHIKALKVHLTQGGATKLGDLHRAIGYAIEHGMPVAPERTRIKRGDVIESPKDAARYDVPAGTLFRDRDGDSWEWIDPFKTMFKYAPLRCIDVPNTDGKCPTCSDPSSSFRTRLCPTCFTDYREPVTEQKHEVEIVGSDYGDATQYRARCTCGWTTGKFKYRNEAATLASLHKAAQS